MSHRAAIYLRISLDQTGEGLAHDRQREDCLAIIKQRGWKLSGEFRDEVSASDKTAKRPGYDALVDAFKNNLFDALVCYDLDRLTRQPRQLEDWIDAAEDRGLALVTANGEADLTTDGGRMYARVKVAVARAEVDRKSARQRRAAKQRSELGRPPLGVRLTGYTVKGDTVADEAKTVKRIFSEFRAGESLRSIARNLTTDGVASRTGKPWNPSSIRTILTNPRYCGRAVYQGEPTGSPGNWKALVSEDSFDVVQAQLADPARVSNRAGTDRKHLGSGLYLCGLCEEPVSSWSGGRYRCKEAHSTRAQSPIDKWVRFVVAALLRKEADRIQDRIAATEAAADPVKDRLDALRTRRLKVNGDYDAGLIDGQRYASATARINAEMAAITREMARHTGDAAVAGMLATDDPAKTFLASPLMTQRAAVDALVTVKLFPAPRGRKEFDPDSVEVTPK